MVLQVLDLFSGIGGFALGLESTGGFRTVAFCEIEPFCREVLRKHWPDVPIHEDVRELRGEMVGPVDVICGGFPCQDISVAGKGAGLHGARSGLWFEAARLVGELGPRWCLFENVGALRTRGIDRVCSDLEAEGYAVWPLVVGAWAVGAPHRRERVWIVAHRNAALREQPRWWGGTCGSGAAVPQSDGPASGVGLADPYRAGSGEQWCGGLLDGERTASRDDADGRGEWPVGSPTGSGLAHGRLGTEPARAQEPERHGSSLRWPARPGEPQHEWEEPRLAQQPLGSAAHGLPERLARRANREALRALGNSVVPQVVASIGRAILEAEAELTRGA